MHIKQRRLLVLLLIIGQLSCMVFGVAWATGWLSYSFDSLVRNRVLAEGRSIAGEIAAEAATLETQQQGLEVGTKGWKHLQAACEKMEVPYDGFVVLFRRDSGAMVCHPSLPTDPALLEQFPGRAAIEMSDTVLPLLAAIERASDTGRLAVHGLVEVDGTLHTVTACTTPSSNLVAAVHQPETSIDRSIAQLVQPVFQVGYALTAFILGATSILTVFLVNRYEHSLASTNARLEEEVERRTESLLRTRNAVVFGLARLAESRDSDTGRHLERIRSYVTVLATELAHRYPHIDHQYVADLAVASSLHDIGKVGVPDAVLLKPGKLTASERSAMQLHTELGSECLAAIQEQLATDDFLGLAQQIAASHHEHWDGNGYPKGLKRKDIPLAARIVALADVYDALTSVRPYKEAVSHEDARNWIASRRATQFDPEVVEAFLVRERDFQKVAERCKQQRSETGSQPLLQHGLPQHANNQAQNNQAENAQPNHAQTEDISPATGKAQLMPSIQHTSPETLPVLIPTSQAANAPD
jgi:response regulator RpfG family c-di-GMP phosphodiesterase